MSQLPCPPPPPPLLPCSGRRGGDCSASHGAAALQRGTAMLSGRWLFCVKVRDIPYWLAPDETSSASARNSRHRRTASLTRPHTHAHTHACMHERTHARMDARTHANATTQRSTQAADAHSAAMCTIRCRRRLCTVPLAAAAQRVGTSWAHAAGFSSRGWSWPKSSIRLAVP